MRLLPRLVLLLAALLAIPVSAAVVDGRLDLRGWEPTRDGVATLDGDWDFVPHRLVGSTEAWPTDSRLLAVPGPWNAALAARRGIGTYRLRVACDTQERLALVVPFQHSASQVFVNGALASRQGMPGAQPGAHEPSVQHQLVTLEARCPMDIRVQVSNHELFRGGLVRSLQLGAPRHLQERREASLARGLLAVGAVSVVGLFSLMFFWWRRKDIAPLYFGVFCVGLAISLGLSAERPLQPLFAHLGFDGQMRVLFTNWFLGLLMYPLLLRELYPRQTGTRTVAVLGGFSGAGAVLPLLTPVRVFAHSAPLLYAAAVAMSLYVMVVLVRALLARERGAAIVFAGFLVVIATVAHDVLFYHHILSASLLPYGIAAVALAPAVLMARRFSAALGAQELRVIEQRERSDLLLRATQAGVLDWDATTGTVRHTDRYLEMLGLPAGPDAPTPPPFRSLIHAEDEPRVYGSFLAQLRDRSVRSGLRRGTGADYRMVRADGAVIWVHSEAIAVCDARGRTLRYISTFIDFTHIKSTEQALAVERERLRLLVRSTRAGFGDWDAVRDEVRYTDRFKEMLGYDAGEDDSAWPSIFEMMHPEDRERAHAQFRAMIQRKASGGEQEPGEPMSYRLRRRDGSYIWIHAEGIALVDPEGRTRRFITSYLDVTRFREQEEALRRLVETSRTEQRRLDLVVRAARVGIVDWDGVTHETYYSPRFREIRGYAGDADTAGWPDYFQVMIHPDDRERIVRRWTAFIRGRGPEGPLGEYYAPEQYRLLRSDGSHAWVEVSGIAVRDAQGFVQRWIAAIIDITERRSQHEALTASRDQIAAQAAQLETQNEALKENVRLREEVERISRHDIKTPLNSIVAVPRLLREERKLGPEADELLGIVERAGYRILSMVNLSLDLYKMEQGSYIFRPDAIDLAELVHKVVADVRTHAASKQVLLQLRLGDAPYAWAEELLCYSLVANLLKNAVEASPEGAIVDVTLAPGDGDTVLLRIRNDGMVPESIRATFFQKYATLGKASGTGLGTYSARLMARVQDGDVGMETSAGAGTTLTVQLRAAPAGKVPATVRHAAGREEVDAQALTALPPMRVLLVDDDEYNLLIVRRYLPSPPFTVDTAINGRVALAAAELQWPDLVFMDLDMPVMGGLEAVGRLRAHERATLARRCTIVALSSHEDQETQARALLAGFDRYLAKPVTRQAIHDCLVELHMVIGEAAPGAPPPAPPGSPGTATDVVDVEADIEPILADFLASRRELVARLLIAIGQGDRGEMRRLAHQLAGSFALYGFGWAAERTRWLERNFSEVAPEDARAVAAQLRDHLDTVQVRFLPDG